MNAEHCVHHLVAAQCADCAPVPPGLPRTVVITDGGAVFHRTPSCLALLDGRLSAARAGGQNAAPRRQPTVSVLALGRAACERCFPEYQPG